MSGKNFLTKNEQDPPLEKKEQDPPSKKKEQDIEDPPNNLSSSKSEKDPSNDRSSSASEKYHVGYFPKNYETFLEFVKSAYVHTLGLSGVGMYIFSISMFFFGYILHSPC